MPDLTDDVHSFDVLFDVVSDRGGELKVFQAVRDQRVWQVGCTACDHVVEF
jgi:hypothetical protein